MDERVRFVGRLLDGEKMVALCREFAISRKTGYKIFDRYKEHGLEALTDRSRRPWRYANQHARPPPLSRTAPFHDQTIHVTNCGRICLHRKKINLSHSVRGSSGRNQRSRRRYLVG